MRIGCYQRFNKKTAIIILGKGQLLFLAFVKSEADINSINAYRPLSRLVFLKEFKKPLGISARDYEDRNVAL